jgi:hypothetical protein
MKRREKLRTSGDLGDLRNGTAETAGKARNDDNLLSGSLAKERKSRLDDPDGSVKVGAEGLIELGGVPATEEDRKEKGEEGEEVESQVYRQNCKSSGKNRRKRRTTRGECSIHQGRYRRY